MLTQNLDLFDDPTPAGPLAYAQAFEAWVQAREQIGELRQRSSVMVYRSMWGAFTAWCVGQGVALDGLLPEDLVAYLHSRGGADDLSDRYAWRLLMMVDAVLVHRARAPGVPRNTAARDLLMARPQWRFANSADKTPLPDHLDAAQARRLVRWLLDPKPAASGSSGSSCFGEVGVRTPSADTWQSLRNRAAVALQLGAGLTPGDIRAATLDGVVRAGSRVVGLPWKIRLPGHGSSPAREAPVAPWAGRLLRAWLDTRSALLIAGPALFPSTRSGRAWGKVAQYGSAKAVLAAAGVPDADGGSFRLRHTFALRQLRRGTPPEQVAQWMGLSEVTALARYRRVVMGPVDVV